MTSFRKVLGDELLRLGREVEDLVLLTPDLANAVKVGGFKAAFPNRYVSVGVSEADCLSFAAGLAAVGMKPVVAGFAMFVAEKAFEQIRNSIAYPNLNVTIIATHAGLCVGRDGATHQALEDIAVMRSLPNFTVIAAADAAQTSEAIRAALRHSGPVYLRLGRDQAETVYKKTPCFAIGKADMLREGRDATLIACGTMVAQVQKAALLLEKAGLHVRVLNMATIKPLDENAVLLAAQETGAIITVEDHSIIGGLGSAVAEAVGRLCPVPVDFVGVRDTFGESGEQEELYFKYGLSPDNIARITKETILRKDIIRRA